MDIIYIINFFYTELKLLIADVINRINLLNEIKIKNIFYLLNYKKIQSSHFKEGDFLNFLKNLKKNYYSNQTKFKNDKVILVDLLLTHIDYVLINLLIAKELQKLTGKPVVCLMYKKDYKNKLIANQFGFKNFIYIERQAFYKKMIYFIKSIYICKQFQNEKNYNNFKYNNIEVGKIALESFFRFNKKLNDKNEKFFKILNFYKSLFFLDFFKEICTRNKVDCLVIGESQYLPNRMVFNLCLKNKIKVFARFGTALRGIKIRIYEKYSDRYSHKEKYSKKTKNYFLKVMSQNKNKIEKLYSQQRKDNDIGKEDVWAKKVSKLKKKKIDYSFFNNKKKFVLILPHVMNDGMFLSKWSLYNTPYNWFEETLKIIKNIKSVNWLIKAHPSEIFYKTDLKTKNVFQKFIDPQDKHIKFLDNDTQLKVFEKKISCVVACHGSGGYEYPSIGIPCITTADTRYEHFQISRSAKSIKKYIRILKNIKNIKKVSKDEKIRAKIYWFVRFGTNINFDVLPKIKVVGKLPNDYYSKINAKMRNKNNFKGTFYDNFKIQLKNNNRHIINHKILRDLKFKNYNIKNDI